MNVVYRRRLSQFITSLLVLCCIVILYSQQLHNVEVVEYDFIKFGGKHRCPPHDGSPTNNNNMLIQGTQDSRARRHGMKLILFYTRIFDRIPVFKPETYKCCQRFRCTFTVDASLVKESDAVIFHARDIPSADNMPTEMRTANQRWIFYTHENPYHTLVAGKQFNNMFNWTMSYERKSDIINPYGFYQKKLHITGYQPRDVASEKDKFAVFVNSHCRTLDRIREHLIRDLSKYIKIDVYGECGGIFGRMMCPRKQKRCYDLMNRYKFTLAFENFQCEDYITEKYWDVAFRHEIVPVVYGGKNFKELAIPGSYIDASVFANAEELAGYLRYLNNNNTAYNDYFKWKEFYEKVDVEPWPCRLCNMLHNNSLPAQTYTHFDTFIDPKRLCDGDAKVFQNYL